MRLRNIPAADHVIATSRYVVQNPENYKGKWNELFKENQKIQIEIGMGKGRFLIQMAEKNPDINYIGIERYSSVLLRAVQKLEEQQLENIKFLLLDAAQIEEIFAKEEIHRIYLNFSDPWPKDRHSKRRLPSRQFLSRFDAILDKEGVIEFKTDNRKLFDFAVEEVEPAGWKIMDITYDLHNDSKRAEGNIMTEYEEKFSSVGNPICKYIINR